MKHSKESSESPTTDSPSSVSGEGHAPLDKTTVDALEAAFGPRFADAPRPVRLYGIRFKESSVDVDGHTSCGGLRVEPGTEFGGPPVEAGSRAPWEVLYYPGWHATITKRATGQQTIVPVDNISAMKVWRQEAYDAEAQRLLEVATRPPEPAQRGQYDHLPPHLVPPRYVPPVQAPGITIRRETGVE